MNDEGIATGRTEFGGAEPLTVSDLTLLVRGWRNHWAEVERITSDFPDDIKRVLALRPVDTQEALEQTVAQFAVLFNPKATSAFVDLLDAVLTTIESMLDQDGGEAPSL